MTGCICHLFYQYDDFILFQPPVQVFGMEGRYASALYSAAVKLKQLDTVEKDLLSLKVRALNVPFSLNDSRQFIIVICVIEYL